MTTIWLAAVLALLPALPAPHDVLERSVPARDARVATTPTALRLTFSSAPKLQFVRVELRGPGDTVVALGPLRLDSGRTVVADVVGAMRPGVFTVAWRIAGADGHPVSGRFAFTLLDPETAAHAGHLPSTAGDTGPGVLPSDSAGVSHHDPATMPEGASFGVRSPGYVAIRWLTYTAIVALLGIVIFRQLTLARALTRLGGDHTLMTDGIRDRSGALGAVAATALLGAAFARLAAQSYALYGAGEWVAAANLRELLGSTSWGFGWLIQSAAALAALVAFRQIRRSGRGWPLATIASVIAASAAPLGGHAMSTGSWSSAAFIADGVHVIAAGGWIGGLLALVTIGMPATLALPSGERTSAVASLVHAFSPTALVFAVLVAATGAFGAWLHVGSLPALWTTGYGKVLLWKVLLVAAVAAVGAWNWRSVRPRLARQDAEPDLLRRSAVTELAVAALVIAATAILVATPPAIGS